MKYSDIHRLPIPRLTLAVFALLAAALLVPASAAHADLPTVEEELAIERSCEEWQKVRRCLREDGEIGLQCAAKSPFARFFSMFRNRSEDDEVHVVVVRNAPEDTPARRTAGHENDEVVRTTDRQVEERTETRMVERSKEGSETERKVKRADSDLPSCDGDG